MTDIIIRTKEGEKLIYLGTDSGIRMTGGFRDIKGVDGMQMHGGHMDQGGIHYASVVLRQVNEAGNPKMTLNRMNLGVGEACKFQFEDEEMELVHKQSEPLQ